MREMQEDGVQPDVVTFSSLIKAFGGEGKMERALEVGSVRGGVGGGAGWGAGRRASRALRGRGAWSLHRARSPA